MTAPPGGFDYPALLRGSLIGVVRGLIERVAQEGFPGDHHFLLTFGTSDPGVVMSARLKKRYPEEMTIVLQHRYWDLAPGETFFSVTLEFGGQPRKLSIPYAAIARFYDPSVQFLLQFEAPEGEEVPAQAAFPAATPDLTGEPADEVRDGDDAPKVVSLDKFRKK